MKEKESPRVASGEFANGVDVSVGHGVIDWNTAAAAGVVFGYAIASQGAEGQSRNFAENWKAMKRAGILRGACHYFQPLQDAESQARLFREAVGALEESDLPPALRLKAVSTHTGLNEWDGVRKDRRVSVVLRCLAAIEAAFGRKPIISTNEWFLRQLSDAGELTAFDLWIADYHGGAAPRLPHPWKAWTFWRHSESGSIPGVEGRVGLDYFNGPASALRRGPEPRHAETSIADTAPAGAPAAAPPAAAVPTAVVDPAVDEIDEEPLPGPEALPEQSRPGRPKTRSSKRDN